MENELVMTMAMRKSLLSHKDGNDDVTAALLFTTSSAVFASFSLGCAASYSSAAKDGIHEDLGLSLAEYSVFGSLLTLGATIGALFSGKVTDFLGRKPTLWFSQLFFIIGWLAVASAKAVWILDLDRLCSGIAIGLLSFAIPVYVAEITPKNIRGGCIFANQLFQNCGMAVVYLIGNSVHWRTLALISVVPCFVQVLAMFFIPESPRWLVGIGLMLLQQLSGSSGIGYYASSIFQISEIPVGLGSTAIAILMIPKAFLGLFLVDYWGRRPLLMVSGIGLFLNCLLLAISFTLQAFHLLKGITPIMALVGVVGFIATFALGFGGLPWIIMSEIFPMNIKDTAGSVATFANWSTSWVITYTFNFLLEWSPAGTFYIFAGICGASVLFVWHLVPETKGKTLEEIQASSIFSTKCRHSLPLL
ncbi:PREDICTED: sugar transporter ERD6-like 17 [Tarenaya hassleriana]|uniref:sugar transporter ERD6-like 17 n=1 Tax=Tarenaya hassleriana TaxID=28532 RepID=UPI00053C9822|nr:PREDICTED: sugar transporter ERD6-like 17 [Tarenaya hassleriana]